VPTVFALGADAVVSRTADFHGDDDRFDTLQLFLPDRKRQMVVALYVFRTGIACEDMAHLVHAVAVATVATRFHQYTIHEWARDLVMGLVGCIRGFGCYQTRTMVVAGTTPPR